MNDVVRLLLPGLLATAALAAPPDLVRVPAGEFTMGSPLGEAGALDDEVPHPVRLTRPFALGRTEVTQSLWASVMGADPSYYHGCPECPVESVSWYDCVRFCNALSAREGLTPAYAIDDTVVTWERPANGYRLPTEAEWEYACRAGAAGPFPGGACLSADEANVNGYEPLPGCPEGLNRGEPVAVASFPPNAWGLHDMHGNVHEWCWDRHAPYATRAVAVDPVGPERGALRCLRGGGWDCGAARCRTAKRLALAPQDANDRVGLRLARNLAE
jgi:formylglycine-generating enzyme required for sulfatase activity